MGKGQYTYIVILFIFFLSFPLEMQIVHENGDDKGKNSNKYVE